MASFRIRRQAALVSSKVQVEPTLQTMGRQARFRPTLDCLGVPAGHVPWRWLHLNPSTWRPPAPDLSGCEIPRDRPRVRACHASRRLILEELTLSPSPARPRQKALAVDRLDGMAARARRPRPAPIPMRPHPFRWLSFSKQRPWRMVLPALPVRQFLARHPADVLCETCELLDLHWRAAGPGALSRSPARLTWRGLT
jgi:hypothetical protein